MFFRSFHCVPLITFQSFVGGLSCHQSAPFVFTFRIQFLQIIAGSVSASFEFPFKTIFDSALLIFFNASAVTLESVCMKISSPGPLPNNCAQCPVDSCEFRHGMIILFFFHRNLKRFPCSPSLVRELPTYASWFPFTAASDFNHFRRRPYCVALNAMCSL